jgi:D-lyxose ketol-isomerase
MPKGAGLEWRSGVVTKDEPVKFHVHLGPHVLVPTKMMLVDTPARGTIRLMPNQPLLVHPEEQHRLWVEVEDAPYTCVGIEGRL